MHLRSLCALVLAACAACDRSTPAALREGASVSPFTAADALIREKRWGDAAEALEAQLAERGSSPELAARLAEVYKRKGDVARAIVRLREAMERHPGETALRVQLAQLHVDVGDFERAHQVLLDGRARGADHPALALTLGSVLGKLGRFDEAQQEFARAGQLGAEARVVRFNQALILAQTGKSQAAQAIYEGLVAEHAEWAPAKRELGGLLVRKDPSDRKAIERGLDLLWSCKEALEGDWRLFEAMGDGWLALGDYQASLDAYTQALKLGQNPKSVEDRYRVAKNKQREAELAAAGAAAPPR